MGDLCQCAESKLDTEAALVEAQCHPCLLHDPHPRGVSESAAKIRERLHDVNVKVGLTLNVMGVNQVAAHVGHDLTIDGKSSETVMEADATRVRVTTQGITSAIMDVPAQEKMA